MSGVNEAEYHILSKPGCKYCDKAKKLLTRRRLSFSVEESDTIGKQVIFKKTTGYESWPQVFHEGVHIGGYDNLEKYLAD